MSVEPAGTTSRAAPAHWPESRSRIVPRFVMLAASSAADSPVPAQSASTVTVWADAIVAPTSEFVPWRTKLLAPPAVNWSVASPVSRTGFPVVLPLAASNVSPLPTASCPLPLPATEPPESLRNSYEAPSGIVSAVPSAIETLPWLTNSPPPSRWTPPVAVLALTVPSFVTLPVRRRSPRAPTAVIVPSFVRVAGGHEAQLGGVVAGREVDLARSVRVSVERERRIRAATAGRQAEGCVDPHAERCGFDVLVDDGDGVRAVGGAIGEAGVRACIRRHAV